jgi:hypothetical protein
MKYCIETTDNGCIETLEISDKEKFQRESIKIKGGCKSLGKSFADQLEEAGYCDEIVEKVDEIYDEFGDLDFLQLAELVSE